MNASSSLKKHSPIFFKYAIVGVSGTLVDVGLFAALISQTAFGPTISAAISFVLAVLNNYTWNRLWTYAHAATKNKKQFEKFFLVSCGGLILNILFLHVFSFLLNFLFFPLPIWGSVLAKIGASGTVLLYNFLLNTFWTFRT